MFTDFQILSVVKFQKVYNERNNIQMKAFIWERQKFKGSHTNWQTRDNNLMMLWDLIPYNSACNGKLRQHGVKVICSAAAINPLDNEKNGELSFPCGIVNQRQK